MNRQEPKQIETLTLVVDTFSEFIRRNCGLLHFSFAKSWWGLARSSGRVFKCRQEFVVANHIGIHPMAVLQPEKVSRGRHPRRPHHCLQEASWHVTSTKVDLNCFVGSEASLNDDSFCRILPQQNSNLLLTSRRQWGQKYNDQHPWISSSIFRRLPISHLSFVSLLF